MILTGMGTNPLCMLDCTPDFLSLITEEIYD